MSESESEPETGKCEKCASEISVEADRCPECGYEPSTSGWIRSIGVGVSFVASILLVGLIAIIWLTVFVGTLALTDGIIATLFFGFVLLFFVWVVYKQVQKERQTPTGNMKSLEELGEN